MCFFVFFVSVAAKPKVGVPGRHPFLPRDPVDSVPGVIFQSSLLNVKNTKHNKYFSKIDTCIITLLSFDFKVNFETRPCLNFYDIMNSSSLVSQPTFVIQGSFHQGNQRFGDTAGIQCSCNALVALAYSKFRKLALWKTHDLDFILSEGDSNFKKLGFRESVFVDEFPNILQLENHNVSFNFKLGHGEFITGTNNNSVNFVSHKDLQEHDGSIFVIDGYSFAIMDYNNKYFIFDSHSKDSKGNRIADGTSVLMRFDTLNNLKSYIRETYNNNLFQILNVKVSMQGFDILKSTVLKSALNRQKQISKNKCKQKTETTDIDRGKEKECRRIHYKKIKGTPKHNQILERMRDNYEKIKGTPKHIQKLKNMSDNFEKIKGTPKHERINERKRKASKLNFDAIKGTEEHEKLMERKRTKNDKQIKVERFKTIVQEGPFYFCVCCNRCLYKRSVILFLKEKYNDIEIEKLTVELYSFDKKLYICSTCHKKLLKKEIPCQSVSNKLELFHFPSHLSDIRKLERILIAQRIIFSKVFIMHGKGEFPKLQGAIRNIPIAPNSVCDVLPRGTDSSGVINVELKRKLSYKNPVISQQIRRERTFELLHYLINNNHLYRHISINESYFLENNENVDFNIDDNLSVPNINHFEELNENEFDCEDPLSLYRSTVSETVMISETPNILIDDESAIVAPGEGKTPVSLTDDEYCEELAHPHLFPTGKFGYNVTRDTKLSPTKYFNQRLLNYTQKFSSDTDYIFFAHKTLLQHNLRSQINIALKRVTNCTLNAGMLGRNYDETIKNFVATDSGYKFMSTIKGTPAYWQHTLSDVLAMTKQLGVPSYFMTLSCADLRWNELVIIIEKLNNRNENTQWVNELDYESRCKILNSNPVLLARHFQYRVENFFKEIVLNGELGKIKYYAIRVEFQVRGSPHVHCLLWAENVPKLTSSTEEEYIQHIDKVIKASFPNENKDFIELKNLVKKFQVHSHSKTCRKYNKNECRFGFGKLFCKKTILSKPLPDDLPDVEKHEILVSRNNVISKVQDYIDSHLHPKRQNILDPNEHDYIDIGSLDSILASIGLTYEEYENYLSISPDKDIHLHLKRDPKSCFVNNYFSDGLMSWIANIDIQPVYNAYKAVTYMCAYFSKSEDKCSTAMKQALKEAQDSDKSQFEKMNSIAKVYNSNRECSVQEAVYLTMPELWLRKCFPAIQFVNTNLSDQRYRIFKSAEEIEELPDDSDDLFKRNMLDRYIDRPNAIFKGGKFRMFNQICYATFCANYVLDTSKKSTHENDWQPIVLDECVNELNHETNQTLPKNLPLMNSKEKLKCRKVPKVLRYYTPNKHKYPEKYAHHIMMLFYPFRCEETDLKLNGSYVLKLNTDEVIETVNRNKEVFEPDSDLVDIVLQNYRNDLEHNQDPFAQQENEEVMEFIKNNYDTEEEDYESDRKENFPSFTVSNHQFCKDEDNNALIRSLNGKQREIFDVVLDWGKKLIQNIKRNVTTVPLEPLRIFLTGGGGVGKSHVIKCIYNCLSKLLSYKGDELGKPRVIKLAPTGIAAINIDGTTIHTGLSMRPSSTYMSLSDKQRSSIRNKLMHVKFIIIDEISMVSPKLLLNIHRRLCEIFGTIEETPFAGKSILVCGDLYQLPPVLARPVFSTEGTFINAFNLWHIFKLVELDETMRQQGDNSFIDMLNNVRVGEISSQNEEMIKSRFVGLDHNNYPIAALHLFAENVSVNIHNLKMLNSLSTNLFIIPCNS